MWSEVHCLFLSQKACRDLCIVDDKFPNQVAKCTALNAQSATEVIQWTRLDEESGKDGEVRELQSPMPEYPFQQVASDYFQEGSYYYFIIVCRYSNWLTVHQARKGDSKELVTQLRRYMATFGVMDELSSDGATVYTSEEVRKFLKVLDELCESY